MSSLATIRRWLTQHAKHGDVSQEFKRPRRPVRWVNRATHEHRWLRKPIAYIIGTQPFCGWSFISKAPILIPRWETEEWLHKISTEMIFPRISPNTPLRVIDFCSGSGCIGLSLLGSFLTIFGGSPKNIAIQLIDIDPKAMALAAENIRSLQRQMKVDFVNHTPIDLQTVDLLSERDVQIGLNLQFCKSMETPMDVWIGNPPYIPTAAINLLPRSVRSWESAQALDGLCTEGIHIHKAIISRVHGLSKHSKMWILVLEIGGDHQRKPLAQYISGLFGASAVPSFHTDSSGKTRILVLQPISSL